MTNETCVKKVKDIIDNDEYCPIPLNVIPNYMGINLCSVDTISWTKQDDGQLLDLTIHFIPAVPEKPKVVTLEITSCRQCPNWESERYYTADSFEHAMEWKCGLKDGERISIVDTFDKDPKIPNFCPLSQEPTTND